MAIHLGEVNLRSDGQEVDASRSEPVGSLNIMLKLPGDAPLPTETFILLRSPRTDSERETLVQARSAYGQVDSTGKVLLPAVPPGRYSLLVGARDSGPLTVTRIVSQGQETPGHSVTVTASASQEIVAYLAPGLVTVQGFVKHAGKPVPGAMVVLFPNDSIDHPEFVRRDQSDFDGSFVLGGVLPGNYSLLALEDAWDMPWGEPAALTPFLPKGQSLTIGALMQRTVTLPDFLEPQKR